ncbi:ATP-binding cassette domain-containing protein [Paenibacillus macerans]|uniref:ATP-binding cassette domain-containing protein n=4 Tax=Paenibacillus macerans TaxID=44252 RepID=A0A091A207_PAEMA|nr:ABC transporter ATP-binding protein [Paenibacillus macerans]KFN10356.1 heme ABC exporter, ATP-binding protein CcmA [Paenibacillus macerans]MBS5912669.1 ABC transporter ATP-binding protein [Paenibacillus macerans]MCY7558271.1 energy-coupling factor ABC transporter ATP-binding protein [Paenibacillus macerans]MEC0155339.1 ABC transporter ATP-binding protein [Paenibacillus macerans]MUG22115.1 ATP-binding cassette domain-containing protein [Paenibacillus macerans]
METAVEVCDLRLKFPGETRFVFKDLSFRAFRGEKVLLLGPSGSGKSTLLQVLSGIIPRLVEVPMRCASQRLPRSWGYVFQDPDTQFCMPFVDEELAFTLENLGVPRPEMTARMEAVLEDVGLRLPELHMPIQALSQGMKQRLALASVLLGDPEVLLLDEPSALLDPEGREQIWQSVSRIAEGRTLIIVEHRIEEILGLGLVDRVALFGPDGRLLGQGSPETIFAEFRRELKEFGIWYPGVWTEFLAAPEGRRLLEPVPALARSGDGGGSSAGPPGAPLGTPSSAPFSAAAFSGPIPALAPLVELKGFRGLRMGRPVIEVEHAAVMPGDFIAVTGPNGAGKSSLLLSLMGLLKTEGEYFLRGVPMQGGKVGRRVRRRQMERAAQEIGFVFQNPEFQFVADRVDEEAAFSLREGGLSAAGIRGRTARILRQFGLEGYEGRHPYQLSLGQKRRLSVASAAVREQPLLLLDEPTFGQDAANAFAILLLCEELRRRGTAIVMVTHEEWIAATAATQRWEVREGRLVSRSYTERGAAMAAITAEPGGTGLSESAGSCASSAPGRAASGSAPKAVTLR